MKKTVYIEGMMCPHCEGRVKTALEGISAVTAAEVSCKSGTATVTLSAEVDNAVLKSAVEAQGYTVTDIK